MTSYPCSPRYLRLLNCFAGQTAKQLNLELEAAWLLVLASTGHHHHHIRLIALDKMLL